MALYVVIKESQGTFVVSSMEGGAPAGVAWEKVNEVPVLVAGCLPRQTHNVGEACLGPVGRARSTADRQATLAAGYARTTINHALSSVSGFYEYHGDHGRGPAANPMTSSPHTVAPWRGALAADLGYADQGHFIRDFKSMFGEPPTWYAQRY